MKHGFRQFISVLADSSDPNAFMDAATLLANASPALMLAIFILALLKRWLVLPRELDDRDKRISALEHERNEYKEMAFRLANLGERVATVTEERHRS